MLLTSAPSVPVYAALWERDLFSGVALVTSVSVGGLVGTGRQLLQDPLGSSAVFAGTGFAVTVLIIGAIVDGD